MRSGVPVIVPFCVLKFRPLAIAGETLQVGKVPETVGVIVAVALSRVRENVLGE